MEFDIKIVGGTIVDGTGAPGYRGDIGIKDGQITALNKAAGTADTTIKADGMIVCPGFVDIHTHYDAQIMWDPMLTYSPWHGVTTCVMGNCGFGIAPTHPEHRDMIMLTLEKVEAMSYDALVEGIGDWPFVSFPEYLDVVDRLPKLINVNALIGHTPVRLYVMGNESMERKATVSEIEEMRRIVREGMEAGAIGFSTSSSPVHVGYKGQPVPSRFADFEEIRSLAGVLGEVGTGVIQITVGRKPWFDEFAQLARETGRNVTWTAILTGMEGPIGHREHLRRSIEIFESGVPVIPQVSCRPLQTEFQFKSPFSFERIPIFREVSAADFEGKKYIFGTPEFRRKFRAAMDPTSEIGGEVAPLRRSFQKIIIAGCDTRPELVERSLLDVAQASNVNPVDLALDMALETELEARFRMPLFNDDEDAVAELLQDPHTVIGLSDAGAHASQMYDTCYATHLLGHWVRERQALTIEYAVWMLTGRTSDVFNITDRGRLALGRPADVVVFDPITIAAMPPERVYDLPANADRLLSRAVGIGSVIVNGVLIRHENEDVIDPAGKLPGKLLRGGRAAIL